MSLRSTTAFAFAAALLAVAGVARAQAPAADWHAPLQLPDKAAPVMDLTMPRWAVEPLIPSNRSRIAAVFPGHHDVVALDGGFYQGFRIGLHCAVQRGVDKVASLIVVAASENRSAALILNYADQAIILVPGDDVRPDVL